MMEPTETKAMCPKCKSTMNYQGRQSVGVGAARIYNVPVYLCPMCGCNGWYDEKAAKVVEIYS
jgi:uncharacterized protein with PIN domain